MSTRPLALLKRISTSLRVALPPMKPGSVRTTWNATLTGLAGSGMLPYTRLLKRDRICGRRTLRHCSAVVTGWPSAVTSNGGSEKSGTFASS